MWSLGRTNDQAKAKAAAEKEPRPSSPTDKRALQEEVSNALVEVTKFLGMSKQAEHFLTIMQLAEIASPEGILGLNEGRSEDLELPWDVVCALQNRLRARKGEDRAPNFIEEPEPQKKSGWSFWSGSIMGGKKDQPASNSKELQSSEQEEDPLDAVADLLKDSGKEEAASPQPPATPPPADTGLGVKSLLLPEGAVSRDQPSFGTSGNRIPEPAAASAASAHVRPSFEMGGAAASSRGPFSHELRASGNDSSLDRRLRDLEDHLESVITRSETSAEARARRQDLRLESLMTVMEEIRRRSADSRAAASHGSEGSAEVSRIIGALQQHGEELLRSMEERSTQHFQALLRGVEERTSQHFQALGQRFGDVSQQVSSLTAAPSRASPKAESSWEGLEDFLNQPEASSPNADSALKPAVEAIQKSLEKVRETVDGVASKIAALRMEEVSKRLEGLQEAVKTRPSSSSPQVGEAALERLEAQLRTALEVRSSGSGDSSSSTAIQAASTRIEELSRATQSTSSSLQALMKDKFQQVDAQLYRLEDQQRPLLDSLEALARQLQDQKELLRKLESPPAQSSTSFEAKLELLESRLGHRSESQKDALQRSLEELGRQSGTEFKDLQGAVQRVDSGVDKLRGTAEHVSSLEALLRRVESTLVDKLSTLQTALDPARASLELKASLQRLEENLHKPSPLTSPVVHKEGAVDVSPTLQGLEASLRRIEAMIRDANPSSPRPSGSSEALAAKIQDAIQRTFEVLVQRFEQQNFRSSGVEQKAFESIEVGLHRLESVVRESAHVRLNWGPEVLVKQLEGIIQAALEGRSVPALPSLEASVQRIEGIVRQLLESRGSSLQPSDVTVDRSLQVLSRQLEELRAKSFEANRRNEEAFEIFRSLQQGLEDFQATVVEQVSRKKGPEVSMVLGESEGRGLRDIIHASLEEFKAQQRRRLDETQEQLERSLSSHHEKLIQRLERSVGELHGSASIRSETALSDMRTTLRSLTEANREELRRVLTGVESRLLEALKWPQGHALADSGQCERRYAHYHDGQGQSSPFQGQHDSPSRGQLWSGEDLNRGLTDLGDIPQDGSPLDPGFESDDADRFYIERGQTEEGLQMGKDRSERLFQRPASAGLQGRACVESRTYSEGSHAFSQQRVVPEEWSLRNPSRSLYADPGGSRSSVRWEAWQAQAPTPRPPSAGSVRSSSSAAGARRPQRPQTGSHRPRSGAPVINLPRRPQTAHEGGRESYTARGHLIEDEVRRLSARVAQHAIHG